MAAIHDFDDDLAFSKTPAAKAAIIAAIHHYYPSVISIEFNNATGDDFGIDVIVTLPEYGEVRIDAKCRRIEEKYLAKQDVVLEFQSSPTKIGWTLDETKLTEKVLWVWFIKDANDDWKYTGVPWMISFTELRIAFKTNLMNWIKYAMPPQRNKGYESLSQAVPKAVITEAIDSLRRSQDMI